MHEPDAARRVEPVAAPRLPPDLVMQFANTVAERRAVYGHPSANLEMIAALWTALLWPVTKYTFTALDVCAMMRLVKESRLRQTPTHADSLGDIVGYVDCTVQVVNGPEQPDPTGIAPCARGTSQSDRSAVA